MVNLMPWRSRSGNGGETGGTMLRLRSEVDRLFDRFFDMPIGGSEIGSLTWAPSLDISDNPNEFVLCVEVPGLNPDDIDVTVTGNVVTISGEKKESTESKERGFYHTERRFGSFRRSVELPSNVDADKISAEYDNGVLTLRIPKSEEQQPHKIQVKGTQRKSGQGHGKGGSTSTASHKGSASP